MRSGCSNARRLSTTAATAARARSRLVLHQLRGIGAKRIRPRRYRGRRSRRHLLEGGARPPLEFHLHSEIYRARPDVNVVMHTHPRWSTLLTMVGAAFKTCLRASHRAWRRAHDGVSAVHQYEGHGRTRGRVAWRRTRTASEVARRGRRRRRHRGVFRAGDVSRGKRAAPVTAMQMGEPYVFSEAEQQACRANPVVGQPAEKDAGTTIAPSSF